MQLLQRNFPKIAAQLMFSLVACFRQAQSTRTAKFDPRTLSRKCSRKCTRECARTCPRKCPGRLRFSVQNAPEGPREDSHESAHGKISRAHGNFPVLTKMYMKVCSVNFHMSYFNMFCFLANVAGMGFRGVEFRTC